MNLSLLIFDLDGTLIDSQRDLANSVNAMLRHFARPELSPEVIARYIGDGAPMLVRRATTRDVAAIRGTEVWLKVTPTMTSPDGKIVVNDA